MSDRVLAWEASALWTGELEGGRLRLERLDAGVPLDGIRNATASADGRVLTFTARDAGSGQYAVWRLDAAGGGPARAATTGEFLLQQAVDPGGGAVAYVAPPFRTRGDMSLHLLDLESGRTRLLVEHGVHRDAVPSWAGSGGPVLYHTEAGEVHRVALDGRSERLFPGEHPAASPSRSEVLYRSGDRVLVKAEGGEPRDVTPPRRLWAGSWRGPMSWSRDGERVLLRKAGGALGERRDYLVLELATGERTPVDDAQHLGLAFA